MHVMVMPVVVPMMMVVVVMMVHRFGGRRRRSGRSGGRCFLGDSVSGEAERKHGGGDKALDHGKAFLWLREPQRVMAKIEPAA